jgi:hypothetical protein
MPWNIGFYFASQAFFIKLLILGSDRVFQKQQSTGFLSLVFAISGMFQIKFSLDIMGNFQKSYLDNFYQRFSPQIVFIFFAEFQVFKIENIAFS